MKKKEIDTYMDIAIRVAENSTAERKKVGACIVTPDDVVLIGYNGTPKGWDNKCEDENGHTLSCVLHAESNAIMKAVRAGISLKDATLFSSLSPCQGCSNMVVQSGICRVVYKEEYRDLSPLEFLKACEVQVVQYEFVE